MKKALIIILLLLYGCNNIKIHTPIATSISMATSDLLAISPIMAFDFGERCPYICWIGINPGITTTIEAETILRMNTNIVKETLQINESEIITQWIFNEYMPEITLKIKNDIVDSINIHYFYGLFISEIIDILGEPQKISILINYPPDAKEFTSYEIIYTNRKARFEVFVGDRNGPNPKDRISSIILNGKIDESEYQSWLGYGQIEKYLPGEEKP